MMVHSSSAIYPLLSVPERRLVSVRPKIICFCIALDCLVISVGRTGAGKTSLTLALLRAIPIEGAIYYHDVDSSSMSLKTLRSHIAVIPQQPDLLTGTVKDNIDPFSEEHEGTLTDALKKAGAGDMDLALEIKGAGENISLGQRQKLALARAILRKSDLMILDKATAAIGI